MKRMVGWLAAAALVALSASAFAGSGEKCSYDTQACLNHMSAKKNAGWLGLEYDMDKESSTMRVKKVTPGSPAAKAGFRVGDVLVALNGVRMDADKEELKKAKGEWKTGSDVSYTVLRGKSEKKITATLASMPEDVWAARVGQHMLNDHAVIATADQK